MLCQNLYTESKSYWWFASLFRKEPKVFFSFITKWKVKHCSQTKVLYPTPYELLPFSINVQFIWTSQKLCWKSVMKTRPKHLQDTVEDRWKFHYSYWTQILHEMGKLFQKLTKVLANNWFIIRPEPYPPALSVSYRLCRPNLYSCFKVSTATLSRKNNLWAL